MGRFQQYRCPYFQKKSQLLLLRSTFLHSETQQRTCPELHVALHHAVGQEKDQATLPFCRQTGFTHVNSMNSVHAMEIQMAPQLVVFLFLGLLLLSLPGIHTYMNTDIPVDVGQS